MIIMMFNKVDINKNQLSFCGLQVFYLHLKRVAQLAKGLNLVLHSCTLFLDLRLRLHLTFLEELNILDLYFEALYFYFLSLDLLLVGLEFPRIICHLFLDVVKFLHVGVDLIGEVLNLIIHSHKLGLL